MIIEVSVGINSLHFLPVLRRSGGEIFRKKVRLMRSQIQYVALSVKGMN